MRDAIGLGGRGVAPEFFELIEIPDFGAEKVHQDVAGIDQDPVAMLLSFDRDAFHTGFLEPRDEVLSHRADMPTGAAGCDDHPVGDSGLATQVNGDDVDCLIVVERFFNCGEEGVLLVMPSIVRRYDFFLAACFKAR